MVRVTGVQLAKSNGLGETICEGENRKLLLLSVRDISTLDALPAYLNFFAMPHIDVCHAPCSPLTCPMQPSDTPHAAL